MFSCESEQSRRLLRSFDSISVYDSVPNVIGRWDDNKLELVHLLGLKALKKEKPCIPHNITSGIDAQNNFIKLCIN